jgi:hypothetical protein
VLGTKCAFAFVYTAAAAVEIGLLLTQNLNAFVQSGKTCLMAACECYSDDVAKYLVEQGGNHLLFKTAQMVSNSNVVRVIFVSNAINNVSEMNLFYVHT